MNGALAFAATTIPPPHNANQANIVHYTQRTGIWKQRRPTAAPYACSHGAIVVSRSTTSCECVCSVENGTRAHSYGRRVACHHHHHRRIPIPYTFVSVCVAKQPDSQPACFTNIPSRTQVSLYLLPCVCLWLCVYYTGGALWCEPTTINYMSHVMYNSIYALKMHNANKMLQKKC